MNRKGFVSILLNALLIFTLVAGVFIKIPVKADAAEGMWILQSCETEYGNDEYLGTDYTYAHEEVEGQIIYYLTRTFTNIDGTFTGLYTTIADIPPAAIRGGQRVEMRLSATLQGGMDNLLCSNSVDIRKHSYWEDGSSRGSGDRFYNVISDSQEDGYIDVWSGPSTNRQYEDAGSFYYVFPEGDYEGEKMTIRIRIDSGSMANNVPNGGLKTDWNYVWTTSEKEISKIEMGNDWTTSEEDFSDMEEENDWESSEEDTFNTEEDEQSSENDYDTASGRWVLQSSETEYGNDEYLGTVYQFDHKEIDGQMVYTISSTFTNIDGTFTGIYTTYADIPPASIRGGERVKLNLNANVQGSMDDGICPNTIYLRMRPYNSDGTKSGVTGLYFTKESDGTNDGSVISVWTGPPSNRQYVDVDTGYYDFPEGSEGEMMSIELEISSGSSSGGVPNGGLTTDWIYVWTTD